MERAKDSAGAPEYAASPAAEPAAAKGDAALAAGLAADDLAPQQRKLIQNAELHVQVESYAEARAEIDRLLASLGGFVADARVDHREGQVSSADLTIRVPAEKLAEFLAGTAGHGDVLHETLKSEDITEGYYDLEARLTNAKRMEARLLEIMAGKADTMTSLLEVEREIARVRGEIERMEGKLKMWDRQVALATVKLRLVSKQVYAVTAPPTPPTLGEEIAGTFGGSWKALKAFGQGLLLVLVALAPWLVPLAALIFVLHRLNRRWVAKRVGRRAVSLPPQPDAVA